MTRRMEIELTSSRDDGNWTWRAAGALQPRGLIAASMLPSSPKVGEVLRVEADIEIDGITIVAVLPSKGRSKEPERLEIIRPKPGSFEPVTTSLVGKSERRGRGRDTWDGGSRGGSGDGRPGPRPRPEAGASRTAGATRGPRRDAAPREGAPTSERRPARSTPESGERVASAAPRSTRPAPSERPARPERPTRTRPPRLVVGTTHRDTLLATYPPEQRPIADQLAQGGLAAVRRTLADEQTAAKAAGRSVENNDAILAVAEQMLPAIRQAVWLDRAEAAIGALETITLRDLRATVAGAAPRDEAGREALSKLREALNERVNKLRSGWESEIAKALDEDRILQALRLSARPPEPTTRFPAALVERLVAAGGAALDATVPKDRWLALLEAASNSPVRRSIHPVGIPEDATGAVRQAATEAAGRIPALAKLLGLAMPPPPRPSAQRPLPPRPPRPPRPATTPDTPAPTSPIAPAAVDAATLAPPTDDAIVQADETPADLPAEIESTTETPEAEELAADTSEVVDATESASILETAEPSIEITEPEAEPEAEPGAQDQQPSEPAATADADESASASPE